MSELKNVLVIGASGNLGSKVVPALEASKKFNLTILTRPISDSKRRYPSSIPVITADYEDYSALVKAFQGQDVILFLVGPTGFGQQQKFVDAAIDAGVKRFVPGEFGSDYSGKNFKDLTIMGEKVEMREYLAKKAEEGKIDYTLFVTGPFFDWGMKNGFLGFDMKTKTATMFDSGKQKISFTTLPTIGNIVAAALSRPDDSRNVTLYTRSYEASQHEILADLEKISGEKWNVKHVACDDEVKEGKKQLQSGNYMGIANLIHALIFDKNNQYGGNITNINTKGWVEEDKPMFEELSEYYKSA